MSVPLTSSALRIQYLVLFLFIFTQAWCPFEEDVYTAISEDWQVKPVTYLMDGVGIVSHPALDLVPPPVLYLYDKKDVAQHAFIGFIGNCVTVYPLKCLVNRQRPEGKHSRWDASFPSGHVSFNFTQAFVYSHHCPKLRIPLYLYATVVGFSRIYQRKHYPTDVIGGAVVGILVGYLTIKLFN